MAFSLVVKMTEKLSLYERGRLRDEAREARNKRRRNARARVKVTPKQYKAAVDLLSDALIVTNKALVQIFNWPGNESNAALVYPIFNDNKFIIEQIRKKIPR